MDDQRQRTWRRLWAAVVLVVSVATIGVVPSLASPDPDGALLLPDLDQAAPSRLFTYETGLPGAKEFGLAFDSAVDNVGQGPLLMHGNRQSLDTPQMVATQRVRTAGGATIDHPDAGTMRYVESSDHDHWHLDGFDRYELRRPGDQSPVRPDRKTGFCLGDRYETDRTTELPGEPQAAQMTGYCEPSNRNALTVDQGMSVGWGDSYAGRLEGQSVDVTGLAAGPYLLVHRVNADGVLEEVSTANNAASVLFRLSWPLGTDAKPAVTVLARCPSTDTCAEPPATAGGSTQSAGGSAAPAVQPSSARPGLPRMTADNARYFVRQSLIRRFGRKLGTLRQSCTRRTALSFSCRARFARDDYRYRGRVWVGYALIGRRVTYRRRIDVTGTQTPCRRRKSACRRHVRVGP